MLVRTVVPHALDVITTVALVMGVSLHMLDVVTVEVVEVLVRTVCRARWM